MSQSGTTICGVGTRGSTPVRRTAERPWEFAPWFATDGDDWTARFLQRIDTGLAFLESGIRL